MSDTIGSLHPISETAKKIAVATVKALVLIEI